MALLATGAFPGVARAAEMKVTLFGQPCTLKGPVDEKALRAIHSLSPEQVSPHSIFRLRPRILNTL